MCERMKSYTRWRTRMLSSVSDCGAFKWCSVPRIETTLSQSLLGVGITTSGRHLAGCPAKTSQGETWKILSGTRSWPSASLALKSDLVTPFLKDPFLKRQIHMIQFPSLNQRDSLLIHRDTRNPHTNAFFRSRHTSVGAPNPKHWVAGWARHHKGRWERMFQAAG